MFILSAKLLINKKFHHGKSKKKQKYSFGDDYFCNFAFQSIYL